MRVLQINSVYGVGSTGRIVEDIEDVLTRSGHECFVAYGMGRGTDDRRHHRMQSRNAVRLSVAQTRLFGRHGFYNRGATKRLLSWIADVDPDVVHLHNVHGHYINLELLFGYLASAKKPVVWTLHDCWPFTGHCAYADYLGCSKWVEGCHRCEQRHEYPGSWFLDRSTRNYRDKKALFNSIETLTIVTPSGWLAGLVGQSFLGGYPVRVVPNGINLHVFKPTVSSFRCEHGLEDRFVILGVAPGFSERKGFKYFVDLAAALTEDETIVLVGASGRQLASLPSSVIGVPRTDSASQLAGVYSAADVLLNPTLEDNFPTVNIEALACGTPVITFNTGGSAEAVDSRTGVVVERGSLNGLREAIRQVELLGRGHFQRACLERAGRLYDRDHTYGVYVELLEEAFRASGAAHPPDGTAIA